MDQEGDIFGGKYNATVEEAYKMLKANVLFYGFNKTYKTLTITSYSAGEGKSTTSVNLGVSMAKSEKKVLYVDADLRKPSFMKSFNCCNLVGLSDYLMGNASMEEAVNSTSVNGFYFIPCGVKPLDPVELLESKKFTEFLALVRERFDVIIFDTPPLGSVIDATIIASQTDSTLLVISSNKVKAKNARRIIDQLKMANANILGVVLNKVPKNDYKGYYKDYDYYGKKSKYINKWMAKKV